MNFKKILPDAICVALFVAIVYLTTGTANRVIVGFKVICAYKLRAVSLYKSDRKGACNIVDRNIFGICGSDISVRASVDVFNAVRLQTEVGAVGLCGIGRAHV